LRKAAAAGLAVPVLALLYASHVLRRSLVARLGVASLVGLAVVFGAFALTASRPQPATASKPDPIEAVPVTALRTGVRSGHATDAPIALTFSAPMNPASVRANLRIEPHAAVRIDWNADATSVEVAPLGRWASNTYYTLTVEEGALAASGRPLSAPARAVFLTTPPVRATIAATGLAGDRVRLDTRFVVDVSGTLDRSTVAGALRIDPPVAGSWVPVTLDDAAEEPAARYAFSPVGRLAADTTYHVSLADSLRDLHGGTVVSAPLEVRTIAAPSVVRFRPRNETTGVERAANLSVRFTQPMDRASTEAAFSATADGKALKGRVTWAEGDTVLVFDPAANLGYEQKVVVRVHTSATSAAGAPLAAPASATFTTVPEPAPPPPPPTRSSPPPSGGSSGGGSVGSGSWTAVESYYLRLMNCTRTGGLVTSSGGCSSPGGRNVAPLKLDSGISSKVARPYAKRLATGNACTHFLGGTPGDRLRRAGYTSYVWAENLGCRSGDPYAAVLGSHLYFQSERSWSPQGGHYVNLMNAKYDRVGIGVWVYAGRVRLVVDFYHP
jgi:uncharacterized protein YkwD